MGFKVGDKVVYVRPSNATRGCWDYKLHGKIFTIKRVSQSGKTCLVEENGFSYDETWLCLYDPNSDLPGVSLEKAELYKEAVKNKIVCCINCLHGMFEKCRKEDCLDQKVGVENPYIIVYGEQWRKKYSNFEYKHWELYNPILYKSSLLPDELFEI